MNKFIKIKCLRKSFYNSSIIFGWLFIINIFVEIINPNFSQFSNYQKYNNIPITLLFVFLFSSVVEYFREIKKTEQLKTNKFTKLKCLKNAFFNISCLFGLLLIVCMLIQFIYPGFNPLTYLQNDIMLLRVLLFLFYIGIVVNYFIEIKNTKIIISQNVN